MKIYHLYVGLVYTMNPIMSAQAINAYLQVMNTKTHRHKIIRKIVPNTIPFLGSWFFFDPSNEEYLSKKCRLPDGSPTTEAESKTAVVRKVRNAVSNVSVNMVWFTLCVVTDDALSHTAAYLYKKNTQELKIFNSSISVVANYQYNTELDCTAINICNPLKIHRPSIGGQNPQDICQGSWLDIASSYLTTFGALHNDGFCQTWCVLMLMNEIAQMQRKNYNIANCYFTEFISSREGLQIVIREFILWVVKRFQRVFGWEFDSMLDTQTQTDSYICVLRDTFKQLHKEIEIPETWCQHLYV